MPQKAWGSKRERQYEHVKESTKDRGASEGRAKEIAARTVNKNRAQSGESDQASPESVKDESPQQRGGQRSGNRTGPQGRTKQELYGEARRRNIKGRSSMSKSELEKAVGRD
ncbi:plasmid stabilization protein [Actinopolymorpha sp. NPDC004070]|uniref:plasmid stabilization protein n=1 Tax=Actinopolymorpha sp. NPDC004070 TaxID=3154548 RepID=UPI0033B6AC13